LREEDDVVEGHHGYCSRARALTSTMTWRIVTR
jgi:hypothetical protein